MFVDLLVVGSTIESHLYTLANPGCKMVFSKNYEYYDFEKVDSSIRMPKPEFFSRLFFYNSMAGNVLFSSGDKTIRLNDKTCRVVSDMKVYEIEFGNCLVFDSSEVENEVTQESTGLEIEVIDLYSASNISKSYNFEPIKTSGSLVNLIYPTNIGRVSGAKYVMDFYTISKFAYGRIDDFDYSSTMARFKLAKVLENHGYLGSVESNDGLEIKNSKIKLEHISRKIRKPINLWENTKNIKMHKGSVKSIINDLKRRKN